MRRALTVIVAALVMTALVLGSALALTSLGDASAAVIGAQGRSSLLEDASSALELALRSSSLAYLDTYAMSLTNVAPSPSLASDVSLGLERALENLSFTSSFSMQLESLSANVSGSQDGTLLVSLHADFTVSDVEGDSMGVDYAVVLHHGRGSSQHPLSFHPRMRDSSMCSPRWPGLRWRSCLR